MTRSNKDLLERIKFKELLNISLDNVDYVLTQSNSYLQKSAVKRKEEHSLKERSPKNILFDAGSSSFFSSLWWFICSYQQKNIHFDAIYAYEATLLEPNKYWAQVRLPLFSFLFF